MTTKMIIVPSKGNRALINALTRGYLDEEFQVFTRIMAQNLANPDAANHVEFSQCIFRTINNIFLDNVYRSLAEAERFNFAISLAHGVFYRNCIVRLKYFDELFERWSTLREDKEEYEVALTQSLNNWIAMFGSGNNHELAQALTTVYEDFQIYTPYQHVHGYRLEVEPTNLRPILLYTERVYEANSVYG